MGPFLRCDESEEEQEENNHDVYHDVGEKHIEEEDDDDDGEFDKEGMEAVKEQGYKNATEKLVIKCVYAMAS